MGRTKQSAFLGAFLVTAVLIGGLVGFLLVDLATDRYMPGEFASIFSIDRVDSEGAELSLLGSSYLLDARRVGEVQEVVGQNRSLLPLPMRLAGGLAVQAMNRYEDWRQDTASGQSDLG